MIRMNRQSQRRYPDRIAVTDPETGLDSPLVDAYLASAQQAVNPASWHAFEVCDKEIIDALTVVTGENGH